MIGPVMTELWQAEVEKNIEALRNLLEERRKGAPEMSEEIKALGDRMDTFEAQLGTNTKMTRDISADTGELLDILKSWKGAMRFFGWVGTGVKWLGGIAAAWFALWQLWQKWTGKS